ncbi:PREDICTED: uncharacterized protein LOC108375769 [Rhagoletis zephyria]|uniref:uncharacterized protein LOC108375769 n=1 Tax=Rhagoletis zephyria TaxID=28612 RepID=UPI000811425B|nr:PREDICTED: uncharacterized protein LOC108375769 [Rhagoletis zephyria]
MSFSEFSIVYITFPNEVEAKKLAKKLVQENLVNFANVMPLMQTYYREIKGAVELDAEVMVMAKIRTSQAEEIIGYISEQHPVNSAPEIYTVPISHMSSLLADNLKANLKSRKS